MFASYKKLDSCIRMFIIIVLHSCSTQKLENFLLTQLPSVLWEEVTELVHAWSAAEKTFPNVTLHSH